jgi:hypothetical protein
VTLETAAGESAARVHSPELQRPLAVLKRELRPATRHTRVTTVTDCQEASIETHRGRLHRPARVAAKRETGRRRTNQLRALTRGCDKSCLLPGCQTKLWAMLSGIASGLERRLTADDCMGSRGSLPNDTCDGGGRIGCARSLAGAAKAACWRGE